MQCILALAAGHRRRPDARTSIWDGVYTDAQAERGRTLYMQNCGRCHGADLSGTFEIPPLVGRFMPYWSGSTLDALFDYVSTAMPLDHPGSLGRAANADILAFILKSERFPAGRKGTERRQGEGHQFRSGPACLQAHAKIALFTGFLHL